MGQNTAKFISDPRYLGMSIHFDLGIFVLLCRCSDVRFLLIYFTEINLLSIVCLSVHLFVCLSVCFCFLFVFFCLFCLFVCFVLFVCLFVALHRAERRTVFDAFVKSRANEVLAEQRAAKEVFLFLLFFFFLLFSLVLFHVLSFRS